MRLDRATAADLDELVALMGAYCAFYGADTTPAALKALAEALLADPEREGVQVLARDDAGTAIGFATVFWSWTTTRAGRLGVMNDLFVAPEARGSGAADALIERCRELAREHGAVALEWQTAPDNARAQAVYARTGAERSSWLTYELPAAAP